jgi:hypothetical protein
MKTLTVALLFTFFTLTQTCNANEDSFTSIGWIDRVSEEDLSIFIGDEWVHFKPLSKIFPFGEESGLGLPFSNLKAGQWLLIDTTYDGRVSKYFINKVVVFKSEAQAVEYANKFDIQR